MKKITETLIFLKFKPNYQGKNFKDKTRQIWGKSETFLFVRLSPTDFRTSTEITVIFPYL